MVGKRAVENLVFAVALLDRDENLLGASLAQGLPGEIALPTDIRLRDSDLRPYLAGGLGGVGRRTFSLVSATWLGVRGRQVRLGVYVEGAEEAPRWEQLNLDLSAVTAILETQIEGPEGR